jgi:hypothetical protein
MSGASPAFLASGRRLLGRDREREVLDRLLDGMRGRRGGVLVVHGEPGVGKFALLEYAEGARRDVLIARTLGVEAEIELPFAAIQQLCLPFFELMERLPLPQRAALGVAFGLARAADDPEAPLRRSQPADPPPCGRGQETSPPSAPTLSDVPLMK